VWRVHDDIELANADTRAQWDELPAFVYGQTTTRDLPHHYIPQGKVFKPVIFFHALQPMAADVRVDFPGGFPALWWPATDYPAFHNSEYGPIGEELVQPRPQKVAKYLQWKVQLKQSQRGGQPPPLKPLSGPHWIKTLREVQCDDVYVSVGRRGSPMEREKFVYYDGLLPRVKALAFTMDKDKPSLKNQERFAVFDIWIIDNRDSAKPRISRLTKLAPGAAADVEMTAAKGEESGKALTAQLKDAGLNEDEAASLTTIWTAEFFHSAGLTLFYRLPQEEYERQLPLTVKPRPEKLVRVGLVQQIPFDTELADRIAKLVKQLDDDEFARREAAQKELAKLGPIAFGYLNRLKPTITALEPKRRVEELLEKYDAQRALKNQGE
jgi:hypothetical protein